MRRYRDRRCKGGPFDNIITLPEIHLSEIRLSIVLSGSTGDAFFLLARYNAKDGCDKDVINWCRCATMLEDDCFIFSCVRIGH